MFTIRTKLSTGLKRFRNFPAGRQSQLQEFANVVSATLHRKAPQVVIKSDAAKKVFFGTKTGMVTLELTTGYIEAVEAWEETVAENGVSAVFGTIVRAIAKEYGDQHQQWVAQIRHEFGVVWPNIREGYSSTDEKMKPANPELARLVNQIQSDLASYLATQAGITELLKEMPGVGDAVAASFITNALPDPDLFNPEGFKHQDRYKRWGVIWSALVMEMCGQGTEDALYPNEEVADIIRTVASELTVPEATAGQMLKHKSREAARLAELLMDEDEDEPDMSESEDPAEGDEEQPINMAMDRQMTACIIVDTPADPPPPRDLDMEYVLQARHIGHRVAYSEIDRELKDALTDFRMDKVSGQFSGGLRQPERLMTDQRVFAKRRKVVDPPNATVVVCVDGSGSMNGTRILSAIQIHDALCYALDGMGIRVYSCMYSGGSSDEVIVPVNAPGDTIGSIREARRYGGNGDDAALTWATGILLDDNSERSAIVFLADGQFTNSTVGRFNQRVKDLEVSVFHVDYLNAPVSPFGGGSIPAGEKTIREVAEPLAAGLAKALDLD